MRALAVLFAALLSFPALAAPATCPPDSACLTWSAPLLNTDGSPLTDLAGYKAYSRCSATWGAPVTLMVPTLAYTFSGFTPGQTCFFAVSAFDTTGNESVKSNEVTKVFPLATVPDPSPGSITEITWQVATTPPPSTAEGFNFRATLAYVTDPPNTQFVRGSMTYPTTANGVTFGWFGALPSDRDRSNTGDPRTAGVQQITNGTGVATFRVDLAPGPHPIVLAFGDRQYAQTISFRLLDGTTVFKTVSGVNTQAAQYVDANGAVNTAWATSPISRTFTSYLVVEIGGPGANSTTLAHLQIQ